MTTYVPMNMGCDAIVGVMKNLVKDEMTQEVQKNFDKQVAEEVEKKGAKFSAETMTKLQEMHKALGDMLAGCVEKEATQKEGTPIKKEDVPPTSQPTGEANVAKDEEVLKKLDEMKKGFEEELKKRDTTIAELQKKLTDVEKIPAAPQGSASDATTEVQKKQECFWKGVL
jgi:Skp family chaperone for outer membrane proteins